MSNRSLIVEADGGSRGNPGVAGYGAVVFDADTGAVLAERAAPLGRESNNVAEYHGLIAGLRAAAEIDPAARVAVRMDSKLVIEQMSGRWKIKHPDMRELASQAQGLVRQRRESGGEITWAWIPREQNKHADRLSNDGMDGRTISRDPWREEVSGAGGEPGAGATATTTQQETTAVPAPDIGRPTRVLFVRHGVTDFTLAGRIDGRGGVDPALNEQGLRQVRRAAEAVAETVTGPVQVVTSSLRRARETGRAVADTLGVEPVEDDGWDEQSFGSWDGLTYQEIQQNDPDALARLRRDAAYAPDGGESHHDLEQRVRRAYRRGIERVGPGATLVVATHRKPIMVVLAGLLGVSLERSWMLEADPASLSEVRVWKDEHASVSLLNQTSHL